MWKVKKKYSIDVTPLPDKEEISSLYYNGEIYVGREDGKIDCFEENKLYTEQCFLPKFDYLESCDILERVVAIQKLDVGSVFHYLFATNERNLKILKVRNSESTSNLIEGKFSEDYKVEVVSEYNNAHSYIINSLSLNSDKRFLISSDYLKINLLRTDRPEKQTGIIDVKPLKSRDLVFVITSSKFSPYDNTVLGYSSTGGDLKLHDLRLSSKSELICNIRMSSFGFEGVLKSVSDFSFIDTNLIALRNLNSISVFDKRNPESQVFSVRMYTDHYLSNEITNTDLLYERFKICNNSRNIFTGSFNNTVNIIDVLNGERVEVEIERDDTKEMDRVKYVDCGEDFFTTVYDNTLYVYENK